MTNTVTSGKSSLGPCDSLLVGVEPKRNFTILLAAWSRVLLEKLTGLQLVKKFPSLYGTRMFITTFKSARHLSLSWASSIHSIPPHPTSWRSILILSSHLRLGLPSGLFPSGFPPKACTHISPPPYALDVPPFTAKNIRLTGKRKLDTNFAAFLIDVLRESIHSLSFTMQTFMLEPMLKSKINCTLWASKWRRNVTNRSSHLGDTANQVNPFTVQSPSAIARSHQINPLNAELNPICYLLALLELIIFSTLAG